MKLRIRTVICGLAGLAGAAVLVADSGSQRITPADNEYAKLAGDLQKQGRNFDQVFAGVCTAVLSNTASTNAVLTLHDHVRSMFGGLWLWVRKGGTPTLQGRNDWAMHFIGGGAFQGYWDVGRSAAIIKERVDMRDKHNFFDLDDMAATILGARWMDIAVTQPPEKTRQWLELWASERYTLSRSLPKLNYGRMPPGKEASQQAIREIAADVEKKLQLPDKCPE